MDVQVNYLGVFLAMVASMVVGSVWYARPVFGNTWMKLTKVDPNKPGTNVWQPIIISVVVSLITAYVLAHVVYLSNQFFQHSFLQDALSTAFWAWLGFTAARFITHDAFEGRPMQLTLLNISHELTTLMAMGLVIGLIGI